MRLKHQIEGAVLAVILLWQLSASALAVGAGTAAPFSWGSLALDGTEYRVICRTGQDALGDLDAVDPYGVRDDAALYALRFAAAEYLKLTWSKSTSPFFTSKTGSAGFCRLLVSSSTSQMRLPEACAIVSITKIIESIIRLMRI